MSTQAKRLRRHDGSDEGFTLIEVIVALSIFAVVAVAALPLLMVGLKASQMARVETLAKDISQLRIERLRNLPFQVDRQNGPFVDLLDRYFTHADAARPAAGTDEPDCSGVYLAAAPGTGGAPSGPAYRVTCDPIAEAADFSQVVYTQFLQRTRVSVTPPAGYDSQVTGKDTAPSRLVGVTVLTSWDRGGQKGTLRTYTEVADARSNRPLITTQAQAIALRVTSNDATAGRSLLAQAGEVKADGSLTTGSVASVQTIGATLDNVGVERLTSSLAGAEAPPNPAGSVDEVATNTIASGAAAGVAGWDACGWGWFGKSAYGNVSSTTALGRPVAPSNTTTDVTAVGSTTSQAGLLNSGNGCQSYSFGFRNWLTSPGYATSLGLSTLKPLVFITDPNAGGTLSNGRALGEASVTATDILEIPHTASAMAKARVSTVRMLPTAERANGLVTAALHSSQLTCKSNGTASTVTASYSLTVTYPGVNPGDAPRSTTVTLSPTSTPSLLDPADISFFEGGVLRTLDQYVDWDISSGVTESTSGAQSIDHVFSLTSPASVVGPGGLSVQLGSLSCTAADNR